MRRSMLSIGVAVAIGVTPVAVMAASGLVQTMKGWNRTSKSVDAMLTGHAAFDGATARVALQQYADGADQIAVQLHGKSADAQDYHTRFVTFAADAKSLLPATAQPTALKAAFTHLMAECSSCHTAYRN